MGEKPSVFILFYLKDIEFQLDGIHSLGPIIAAGQAVDLSNSKGPLPWERGVK